MATLVPSFSTPCGHHTPGSALVVLQTGTTAGAALRKRLSQTSNAQRQPCQGWTGWRALEPRAPTGQGYTLLTQMKWERSVACSQGIQRIHWGKKESFVQDAIKGTASSFATPGKSSVGTPLGSIGVFGCSFLVAQAGRDRSVGALGGLTHLLAAASRSQLPSVSQAQREPFQGGRKGGRFREAPRHRALHKDEVGGCQAGAWWKEPSRPSPSRIDPLAHQHLGRAKEEEGEE